GKLSVAAARVSIRAPERAGFSADLDRASKRSRLVFRLAEYRLRLSKGGRVNRKVLAGIATIAGTMGLLGSPAARGGNGSPINKGSADQITLAVFGDWPYSQALLDSAPLLIDSVNSDPKVRLVMHVGDIHSGRMPCTGADLTPVPTTSVPDWNKNIFNIFAQF